jgi:sugar/nucleoside kinase (ribokinase family)
MIDYLLLGHAAHDRTPNGPQLGGTVAYASATAGALGLKTAILTSAHPADPVLAGLDHADYRLVPAESSTIFVNTYTPGGRVQMLEGQAAILTAADVPTEWRSAPVVHLGPIAQELDATLTPATFPGALVGVTPQGYMRTWDAAGRVSPIPWAQAAAMLPTATVTILSQEDLGFSQELERDYAARAARLVVTRADLGATLYTRGARRDFPAPVIAEVRHPTGAGDVFAAALLSHVYLHPGDWDAAMRAAVTLASVFVERCPDPGAPTLNRMREIAADVRVREVFNTSII